MVSHLDKKYSQLRNDQEPIGDKVLFRDLSKSVKDAKALGEVSRSLSKNGQRLYSRPFRKRPFRGNARPFNTKKARFNRK